MVNYPKIPYDEAFEYLNDYANADWLEFSFIVDHANQVAGAEANAPEIIEVTLRLAADLIDNGAKPGNLAYGPTFVPWPGTKSEQLARIVKEIDALGKLPYPGDICCFHTPNPSQK